MCQSPRRFWLMAVVILLFLWIEETWVIVDFHSPPLRHYVHYFGFYAGMTAAIIGLYTRYRYTVLQCFIVGGLWGVLVEQQWKGPKLLLSGAIVEALTFALYIFPVYGLYLAAPACCSSRSSTARSGRAGAKGSGSSWGSPFCPWQAGWSGRPSFRCSDSTSPACLDRADRFRAFPTP